MNEEPQVATVLEWCRAELGFEAVSDHTRSHPGQRAAERRLRSPAGGYAYLKMHRDPAHWENEVHAYEQWAPAFEGFAPRLLAVRVEEPLALVISELPGRILEDLRLPPAQDLAAWHAAGRALAGFHEQSVGTFFGPCRRDGTSAGKPITDAREYIANEFDDLVERGQRGGFLSQNELDVVQRSIEGISAFEGERPVPCHRDYCPANWLVGADGAWTGVIDFEFSGWDVRAADFSRYPNWDWIEKPERTAAFLDGYGRVFTPAEEVQRKVSYTQYALGAVVWGMENAYYGFAKEGHQALKEISNGWRCCASPTHPFR